jgi:hypothetical protein
MTGIRQRWLRLSPIQASVLLTAGLLFLLQLWRPHYFLTDDNLVQYFPVLCELGRNAAEGRWELNSAYLFGGQYPLGRDPLFQFCFHPLLRGLSLLGATPARFWIIDLFASFQFLLMAGVFSALLAELRRQQKIHISNAAIIFLTLSYTAAAYPLIVGPCWMIFLGPPAVLPLFFWGIIHPRRAQGVPLIFAGLLHGYLSSQSGVYLFCLIFAGLLAAGWCWIEHKWEPLLRWMAAGLLAAVVLAPLWLPAMNAVTSSPRQIPAAMASLASIPAPTFLASFFAGGLSYVLGQEFAIFELNTVHGYAMASCASGGLALVVLLGKRRWTRIDGLLLGLSLLVVLLVARPVWLGELVSRTPLLRSTRWPFRETFLFLFFIHLWLAFQPLALDRRWKRLVFFAGILVFVLSLVGFGPPSFAPRKVERRLLFSGEAEVYWEKLKAEADPAAQWAVFADGETLNRPHKPIPALLLGLNNYPALFSFHSLGGYTTTPLSSTLMPDHPSGAFSPHRKEEMMRQYPGLQTLTLISDRPLTIEYPDGSVRMFYFKD